MGTARNFRSSCKLRALLAALQDGLKCIAEDIDFCDEDSRKEAESLLLAEMPNLKFSWEFFANDRAACEVNVKRRNSPGIQHDLSCIEKYSHAYHIPDGAVVLPEWRNKN